MTSTSHYLQRTLVYHIVASACFFIHTATRLDVCIAKTEQKPTSIFFLQFSDVTFSSPMEWIILKFIIFELKCEALICSTSRLTVNWPPNECATLSQSKSVNHFWMRFAPLLNRAQLFIHIDYNDDHCTFCLRCSAYSMARHMNLTTVAILIHFQLTFLTKQNNFEIEKNK